MEEEEGGGQEEREGAMGDEVGDVINRSVCRDITDKFKMLLVSISVDLAGSKFAITFVKVVRFKSLWASRQCFISDLLW